MMPFSERLAEAVRRKGPLCVGIDPRWDMLPLSMREDACRDPLGTRSELQAPGSRTADRQLFLSSSVIHSFCTQVLELVAPYTGVVKFQAAFFELLGEHGIRVLRSLIESARQVELVVILDAKRGDIASTALAYADAAFGGCTIGAHTYPIWNADALTVNPYLGEDAVEPFLTAARTSACGVFILVRTSNAGSGLFQDLLCDGLPLYRHVAAAVRRWNEPTINASGFGDVGAVVGATHPRELAELRNLLPNSWFLVPGYGAQGGTASDVKAAYRGDGLGAVVNSSRGVVFPFQPHDVDWKKTIIASAKSAAKELKA